MQPQIDMEYDIKNEDFDRLSQVVAYTELSVVDFFKSIGRTNANFYYDIKSGRNKYAHITKGLAKSIVAKYPNISLSWLMTGQGSMLDGNDSESMTTKQIINDLSKRVARLERIIERMQSSLVEDRKR